MAGEISTGYGAQGENASGIGAFIFGQEKSPLEIQLLNNKALDEAAAERQKAQANKLKVTGALLGDIDPKTGGSLETDIPDLQAQTRELHQFLQQGLSHGFDPTNNSPQNQAFLQKIRNMSKQIELNATGSANAKEMVKQVATQLGSDKNGNMYDADATNKKLADFRSMGMAGRQKYASIDDILVRKPSDLLTLTKDKVLKDIPLDSESVTRKDPVTGGFITETKETYTPEHIAGLARGAIANPDILDRVMVDYNTMDGNKKIAYQQQAKAESAQEGRNVTPQEIAYRDFLDKLNPKKEKKEGLVFSPQQHAYWNHYYDNQEEEQNVKYIAETLNKALTADTKFWGIPTEEGIKEPVAGTIKNTFGIEVPATTKTYYSNALNGLPLGQAVIPIEKQGGSGENVYTYTDYQNIPNRVLNMSMVKGQPYIQTDESIALQQQGTGDGWEKVDDRTIDKLVLGSKNPTKAASALRKTLLEMNAYPNKNVELGGGAKPTTTKSATKLSGKINPSTLVKGSEYDVNGTVYVWDGSKLQPK